MCDIFINKNDFYNKLLTKGELGLAESYMDGDWTTKDLGGLLYKLLHYQDIFEEQIDLLFKSNVNFEKSILTLAQNTKKKNL